MMISDEDRKVARDAALFRWGTGSADTTQMLLSVDAALAALPEPAVPYLMPDREALMEVLEKWDVGGWKYEDKAGYRERVATSLLALLSGSEVPSDQPS